MTIYLPTGIQTLKMIFTDTCDRILASKEDSVFYSLLIDLMHYLRKHILLKSCIADWETALMRRKEAFNADALVELEETWLRHGRYHSHRWKWRRRLAQIKRKITTPLQYEACTLYMRIISDLWAFRYFSSFCRFIETGHHVLWRAVSDTRTAILQFEYQQVSGIEFLQSKRISLDSGSIGEKVKIVYSKAAKWQEVTTEFSFRWSGERLPDALFSPRKAAFEAKYQICGKGDSGKQRNYRAAAAIDPVCCWERLQVLERWHMLGGNLPPLEKFKGKWLKIRKPAWEAAEHRCEIEALLFGALRAQHRLPTEIQISKPDYAYVLELLKQYVLLQILKLEDAMQPAQEDDPLPHLAGTQKSHFVIDLAHKFWKQKPHGTKSQAFEFYQANCPKMKRLKEDQWGNIVTDHKLDPRAMEERRRRGPGKKRPVKNKG